MSDIVDRLVDHASAHSDSKDLLVAAAHEIALLRQDVAAARGAFDDWRALVVQHLAEAHGLLCKQAEAGDRLRHLASTPTAWDQTQLDGIAG